MEANILNNENGFRISSAGPSSTLHLQFQLFQSNGLAAWHCKVSSERVCVQLATPSFSESVTHSFPSAQIFLHFD
jgi:hypothetical protein